jgi:hypothetical protein
LVAAHYSVKLKSPRDYIGLAYDRKQPAGRGDTGTLPNTDLYAELEQLYEQLGDPAAAAQCREWSRLARQWR